MTVCIVTGSSGLVGSQAVEFMLPRFDLVIGIDNNMREYFFGKDGSTLWNRDRLKDYDNFQHKDVDIRNHQTLCILFNKYGSDIKLIIHAAAQPSHDWAAQEPLTDFGVNAVGTVNMLECTRQFCPEAVFIFCSTNKVYGDGPNTRLMLFEKDMRYEHHDEDSRGITETFPIDHCKHSVFGASKVAADIMVQEYANYFGIQTGVFRGGCITGGNHSGAKLHGFLSYLMKCAISGEQYTIIGYKGKQVRDNIHAYDLVNMFWHFYLDTIPGEVFNAGGGRHSNCSVLEAIEMCENITGKKMNIAYNEKPREGDHIWYISDVSKFKKCYPAWNYTYNMESIITELYNANINTSSVIR